MEYRRKMPAGRFEDVAFVAEGYVWVETAQRLRLPASYLRTTPRFRGVKHTREAISYESQRQ